MTEDKIIDFTPKQNQVRIGCLNGRIVILYEKPIDHVELTPDEAMSFIQVLIQKINELKIQNGDGRLIGSANA